MANGEASEDFLKKYKWMIRPCEDYKEEACECTSIRGRFHQYFIYGEFLDCSNWIQDEKSCKACIKDGNNDACLSVIKNETQRRLKRIHSVKANDVWKKRDKPPANWNPPLSKYWQEKSQRSLLTHGIDEYKKYISTHEPDQRPSCTIL